MADEWDALERWLRAELTGINHRIKAMDEKIVAESREGMQAHEALRDYVSLKLDQILEKVSEQIEARRDAQTETTQWRKETTDRMNKQDIEIWNLRNWREKAVDPSLARIDTVIKDFQTDDVRRDAHRDTLTTTWKAVVSVVGFLLTVATLWQLFWG